MWTYQEAANQAHCRCLAESSVEASLDAPAFLKLGRLLQTSQSGDWSEAVGPVYLEAARKLMQHLSVDLQHDEAFLTLDVGHTDMQADLIMVRRSDNRFFSLELVWSAD